MQIQGNRSLSLWCVCVRFASVLQEGDLIAGPSDLSAPPPLSDESENVLATSGIDRVNYIWKAPRNLIQSRLRATNLKWRWAPPESGTNRL